MQHDVERRDTPVTDLFKSHRVNLDLVEVGSMKFHPAVLKQMLPDIESALFFGKLFSLKQHELATLLHTLFKSSVIEALTTEGGAHSVDLQDYIVEIGYEYLIQDGDVVLSPDKPAAELLPQLFKDAQVEVATSIKEVAEKLKDVISSMPGKQGQMVFESMMVMNSKRPVIGDFKAKVVHDHHAMNLVIMDVSGSMSERTVRTIVDDVVGLAWEADAYLAIVSNTTTVWQPGEYDSDAVIKAAEFSGTHYETLTQLLDQDWGVVVTIADYDSSRGAMEAIARCTGNIDTVLDISLVNRPTYLAECVGQRAREVKPLLVAEGYLTN